MGDPGEGRSSNRRPAGATRGPKPRGACGGPETPTGPRFVGPKLRIARSFLGLGRAELGERLGIGDARLGRIEGGTSRPPPALIEAIAGAIGFSPAFFEAPLTDEPRDEECHGPRGGLVRRRSLAHASLLAELVAWLDERVQLPAARLPYGRPARDPAGIEAAAAACRTLWGLARDLPVPNLTRVLERAGIVVVRGSEPGAFARAGRRLLVVLSTRCDALGLARLAGHLVLHRGVDAGEASAGALDAEAERFARALLLPREGLLRELPRAPSLDAAVLVPLSRRWKVSLATLVRRAAELPIANAARYQDVADHLPASSALPETSTEAGEAPEVVALALARIEEHLGIRRHEVVQRLGWSPEVFTQVTGLDAGRERSNVISLAAWKARRAARAEPAAPIATEPDRGLSRGPGTQLELDFGPPG